MLVSIFDFIRVLIAFGLLFFVIPCAVSRNTREQFGWRVAVNFARTVLFVEVAAIVLGSAGLCLPGTMMSLYLIYVGLMLVISGRGRSLLGRESWQNAFHSLLFVLENRRNWRLADSLAAIEWRRLRRLALWVILAAATIGALSYPIANDRFQEIGSYSRTLSLEVLTHGQTWKIDGSVAFLAPVVFLSGAPAVAVIRFSTVLLALALAVAAGFLVHRFTGRSGVALLALAFTAFAVQANRGAPELTGAEIALLFWFLAATFGFRSKWDLYFTICLALLVTPIPTPRSLILAGCVLLLALASPLLERLYRLFPAGAVPILPALTLVSQPFVAAPPDGPFQYEAAARAVRHIAGAYPRNNWLVVSPVHETPFLYGRGWHVELTEFVEAFTLEELSRPDFRFPYEPDDLFVFVEKIPLVPDRPISARLDQLEELDPSIIAYHTPRARQSLEFRAAELMAAYVEAHPETNTWYDSAELVIYHMRTAETGARPPTAREPSALE